jgi:hypothetical protein
MYSGDRDINKKEKLAEVILEKKDNVIYVDFVLFSLVEAVKDWYKKYYQGNYKIMSKSHNFQIVRFYDRRRFSNHTTIGEERDKYLIEIDNYVQMRRDD